MDQMRLVNYQNMPNINITKTVDTGTTVFDEDGGYAFKILGKDDSGNVIARKFKLLDITKANKLTVPNLESVEGMDGNEIRLTPLVQELIGPGMFHVQDANLHIIETAINIILRNQAAVISNMNQIVEYLKQLPPEQLDQISHSISEAIGSDYYDKKHTDEFEINMRTRMNNLEAKFPDEPLKNGYFPPNYMGSNGTDENPDLSVKLRRMKNELGAHK